MRTMTRRRSWSRASATTSSRSSRRSSPATSISSRQRRRAPRDGADLQMPSLETLDRDTFFRFYGSEVSYFTGKVRPALRFKRLPHAEVLATPRVYREVIRPRTRLDFIPIVVTPEDETWQDTSAILAALEVRFPEPSLYPRS